MWKTVEKRPRHVRRRWRARWGHGRVVGVTGLVLVASACGAGADPLVPVDTGQRLVCDVVIVEDGGFPGVDRTGCWIPNRGDDEELWVERSDPGEDLQRQVRAEPGVGVRADPEAGRSRGILDTRRGHRPRLLR